MDDSPAQAGPVAPPPPRYYQSTDRVGAGFFLWLALVGGTGASALGAVYALIALVLHEMDESSWLGMVTPFFALALVMLGQRVCRLGEVRRRRLRLPIALFVGAIGLYAAWHVYLNILAEPRIFDPLPSWRMSPLRLWHAMRDLATARGTWSWLTWLLEAATVFGFIVYLMSGDGDPELPFCEKCGHWTTETLRLERADAGYYDVVEEFKRGRLKALRKLRPHKACANHFLQVRVLRCPCGAACFACLDRVTVKPGKKAGLRFGRSFPCSMPKLSFDFGSPRSNEIEPLVTNMELDAAMQGKLEEIRAELLGAR